MTGFNFKVRIPTDTEHNRLKDITAKDDAVIHWKYMFSWVDSPKLVTKYPNHRMCRGFSSMRYYDYILASHRDMYIGFRPAFESLDSEPLPTDMEDGNVITIGTLYMNNKPVRIPQNPVWDGDIEDYIPGGKLEFKPALEDPAYQVRAIKCGDVFICDRCLLKRISYNDICVSFPQKRDKTPRPLEAIASDKIREYAHTVDMLEQMTGKSRIEVMYILYFLADSQYNSKELMEMAKMIEDEQRARGKIL